MGYRPIRNSGQLCPLAVRFQGCPPPAELREQVQAFWQYDVRAGFDLVPIQVFPSGCVVLRFDIGPDGVESVLYPPSASPEMKSVFRRGVSAFGVALRVGRAFPVLGCTIPELGATRTRLDAVWARELGLLEERLFLADSFRKRVAVLAEALRPASRMPGCGTQNLEHRLDVLLSGSDLRGALSDRTQRRQFDRHVGHSPKQLQRIVRVQAVLRLLSVQPQSLTRLAHGSGFCDQSHLNREFVSLLGMTPGLFRRSLGRFHQTDLPIWADVPILQELRLGPKSDRNF